MLCHAQSLQFAFRHRRLLYSHVAIGTGIPTTAYRSLARVARLLERRGRNIENFPLAFYRDRSFYVMRTDALDRFGTRLEQRFTKLQVQQIMEQAGFERITFSDSPPYWCAVGYRSLDG